MGMKVPVMKHFPVGTIDSDGKLLADKDVDWCLCGSLCTTADVIVRQAPFTNLQIGDVLAFANIGAYSVTEGIHLFLSRTMPRILLYHGDGNIQVARDFLETSRLNCVCE